MWSYKLFRIGALVLTVGAAAQFFDYLGNRGAKPVNGTESHLQQLMYGFQINMMGTMRTRGDIYDGLTLAYVVFLLTLAAIGFTAPVQKKLAIVIAASMLVMLGISVTYWFSVPTTFLAAGLLCFSGSAYLDKK